MMAKAQRGLNVHTLTIQQTYRAKDSSEEDLLRLGAICLDKVEEQVDYYDTEWYDLAVTNTWLSKTGDNWRLIVDKSGQIKLAPPAKPNQDRHLNSHRRAGKPAKKHNGNTLTSDQNSNKVSAETDGARRSKATCYELAEESEIVVHLSNVLHRLESSKPTSMGDLLQSAGIHRYASFLVAKSVTYRLRDLCTITLSTDQKTSKKVAAVSLQVDIENVTQGFQSLEELATELDLQLQNKRP